MLIDDRTTSRARPHRLRGTLHALTITLATAVCVGSWGATPGKAQEHDPPQQQVDRLRAERERLAADVAELRRQVEELRAAMGDAGVGRLEQLVRDSLARGDFEWVLQRLNTKKPRDVTSFFEALHQLNAQTREGGGAEPQHGVTVRAGDTLARLAERHLGDGSAAGVDQLLRLNPGLDPRRLQVGQRIVLPLPADPAAEPMPEPVLADPVVEPAPPRHVALPPAAGTPIAGSPRERGDAVALLTQLIELEGEREQAKLRLDQAKGDRDRREAAAIDLRTTERKLQLVRRMVELAVDTATADLAAQEEHLGQIHQLHEKGFVPASDLRRAEAAVVDLRAWLKLLRSSR